MAQRSEAIYAAFERFWDAYPRRRHSPKAAARSSFFRRADEGVDPDEMVRAAGVFARAMKDDRIDAEFIPYAKTWLNQRRYENYLEDPAVAAETPQPRPDHPLAGLLDAVGRDSFTSWLQPLDVHVETERLRVVAPNRFTGEQARARFGALIEEAFGKPAVWRVKRKER